MILSVFIHDDKRLFILTCGL